MATLNIEDFRGAEFKSYTKLKDDLLNPNTWCHLLHDFIVTHCLSSRHFKSTPSERGVPNESRLQNFGASISVSNA
jgi:hypothetical protein